MEHKRNQIDKTILRKENKVEGNPLADFKIYYKVNQKYIKIYYKVNQNSMVLAKQKTTKNKKPKNSKTNKQKMEWNRVEE